MNRLLVSLSIVLVAMTSSACKGTAAATSSASSPTQYGIAVGGGATLTEMGPAEIFGIGGYEYSSWDGGHDDVFSLGLQGRVPIGTGSTMIGGEALYHRWICKSEPSQGCGGSPAANGLGINGLVVRPMADGLFNVWASAGPKWLTDFTQDGNLAFESGFGWHAKVGVEVSFSGR